MLVGFSKNSRVTVITMKKIVRFGLNCYFWFGLMLVVIENG